VSGNNYLKIFKWINLTPMPVRDESDAKDITRIIITESRNTPVSRGEYLNPILGDLPHELIQDVHKCVFFSHQDKRPELSQELTSVL
jgi:hypothetical protein